MKPVLLLLLLGNLLCQTLWAAEPTQAPSNFQLVSSSVDGNSFTFTFSPGVGGTGRLIVMKEGSPVVGLPVDGTDYTGFTDFGNSGALFTGSGASAGEYVVRSGNFTSVTVTNLKPATTYFIAVFEYSGSSAATRDFLTTLKLTGSAATVSAPSQQVSGVSASMVTGNKLNLTWSNGNGTKRLIIARKAAPVIVTPTDLTLYTSGLGVFGSGTAIGDHFVVYNSATTSTTITNLEPNTTYYFTFFEANGTLAPVFNTTGAPTLSVTTSAGPTKEASALAYSNVEGDRLSLNFSIGNGTHRLVIARKGSPVSFQPLNGMTYVSNAAFGDPNAAVSPDEFVVSNGIANSGIIVTNLDIGTTYYFRVYEYDRNLANYTYYLTSLFAQGSRSSAKEPGPATNVTIPSATLLGNAATIRFTVSADGAYRLVLLKEATAVDAAPVDLTKYTGNNNFKAGQQLGSGNYVVAGGTNGNSVNVLNLTAGTTYHVAVYEFNGINFPVYSKVAARATFTTPNEPMAAATGFTQLTQDGDAVRISWVVGAGTGTRRVVVGRKGAAVTAQPADGVSYTANASFGAGHPLTADQFVVYEGSGTYCDVLNLQSNATYSFAVYEYNMSAGGPDYLLTALAGVATTSVTPSLATSALAVTSVQATQASLQFAKGNGSGRLFIMKAGSPVDAMPVDLTAYPTFSPVYGAISLSGSNYLVNNTSAATGPFTITNLAPNTTYHVAVFEYNGTSAPVYHQPGTTFSFTTADDPGASTPASPSHSPVFSNREGNQLHLAWTKGDGQYRIVVARKGTAVDFVPTPGTSYPAQPALGSGTDLGNGQYVVYNGSGDQVTVTGLQPASEYFFTVYEFNGSGVLSRYLTSAALQASSYTAEAPTQQGQGLIITPVSGNAMQLSWTPGNGQGHLVVVKEGSPVTGVPVNLQAYTGSSQFKSGAQLAPEEYVVHTGNSASLTLTGLEAHKTYYIKVFAYNGSAAPVYNTISAPEGMAAVVPLPVTWHYVRARITADTQVQVEWETLTELNAAYYVVEKSTGGADFAAFGRVAAKGQGGYYSIKDQRTATPALYRIKQVDADGSFTYSKVVRVEAIRGNAEIYVYPNPFTTHVFVQATGKTQLTFYDANGKLLRREHGDGSALIEVKDWPSGRYYLVVEQQGQATVKMLIKQ